MRQTSCALSLILLLFQPGVAAAASAEPPPVPRQFEKYDDIFRKYSKRFFGAGFDWRLFKAQAIVESNLRPTVVSARGARGVMQMMTATYGDVRRRNPELGDINDPEWNIAAGIWYSREQWNYWEEEAEKRFRRQFMLGSYNAGRGNLIRAQQLALAQKLNHRRWPSIERVAPKVPNWRYKETLAYVESVFTNLSGMDRKGRVKGPTISIQDNDGAGLADKLKRVTALITRLGRRGD